MDAASGPAPPYRGPTPDSKLEVELEVEPEPKPELDLDLLNADKSKLDLDLSDADKPKLDVQEGPNLFRLCGCEERAERYLPEI